ncbi:hypothetical protein FB382_003923 [Nocardioides ginsengisegetis]|uniref:RNA ligase domain-containing protein n=2 Tax=Nocardioides ginsengisegetis TaxID=661491 RepID=A0A7W3J3D8_9ACTN|nr:RNA ligase family protein [Nocardioides ginsengisegetis]MBA8805578.1 hypothetical protein [Nocardioides ginsengisegetis]
MNDQIEFQPWPKIARLNRDITITEKIDGTNAAVIVGEDLTVAAQSRKRLITPDDDNFGFARWVYENGEALASLLGPGRHFGEWWGSGIQRGYGLTKGEKRFSLFNTARYADADFSEVAGMGLVPVLYQGAFSQHAVEDQIDRLDQLGSVAAPGFFDPEGVIVFHSAAQQMFKVTIKGDEAPKSLAGAA